MFSNSVRQLSDLFDSVCDQ